MTKIKRIMPAQASEIIENRSPRGLFFCKEAENRYIGIDNTTGEVWSEEFENYVDCMSYLHRKEYKLNHKLKTIRKVQKISGNIAMILLYAGIIIIIGLLFCAPHIQELTYYLLLAIAVGSVTTALFIYLVMYGEINDLIRRQKK